MIYNIFLGGTNFGFMNGAYIVGDEGYQPTITSYGESRTFIIYKIMYFQSDDNKGPAWGRGEEGV
jgi:hypothetical protein